MTELDLTPIEARLNAGVASFTDSRALLAEVHTLRAHVKGQHEYADRLTATVASRDAEFATLRAQVASQEAAIQRVRELPEAWEERISDCLVDGADGVADGLNEASLGLTGALDGPTEPSDPGTSFGLAIDCPTCGAKAAPDPAPTAEPEVLLVDLPDGPPIRWGKPAPTAEEAKPYPFTVHSCGSHRDHPAPPHCTMPEGHR